MNKLEALLSLAALLGDESVNDAPAVPQARQPFPFEGTVAIRTVTHYYTGRVKTVEAGFVVLSDASWIPDSGRWSTFLAQGAANEVEPFPDEVAVALGAIVDVAPWTAALPRDVK
jgi:hypothetical protein